MEKTIIVSIINSIIIFPEPIISRLSFILFKQHLTFSISPLISLFKKCIPAAPNQTISTRISELVSAIKRFTYMDKSAKPELVDVEAGLRDTIRVLGSKIKSKGATLTIDVEADFPYAHAIGGELNQIWLNLIDNALDAVSESGNIKIDLRKDRDRVVVRVIDDGQGISPEDMPRIFDPFFTTKPPGEGTGLGLEITRQLVKTNRGDISVQSRPGHTEFIISLVAGKIAPTGMGEQKKDRSGK